MSVLSFHLSNYQSGFVLWVLVSFLLFFSSADWLIALLKPSKLRQAFHNVIFRRSTRVEERHPGLKRILQLVVDEHTAAGHDAEDVEKRGVSQGGDNRTVDPDGKHR
jgi:hypothetical protein